MKRPYVICHILSSLDGKINGPFMGTQSAEVWRGNTAESARKWTQMPGCTAPPLQKNSQLTARCFEV